MSRSFRITLATVLSVVLVLSVVAVAYAASTTGTVTITASVPNILSLTVSDPSVDFGALTDFEVENGKTLAAATSLSVKSNRLYTMSYTADDFTDAGTNVMPIEALTYAYAGDRSGSGTFANAGTLFADGERGNKDYNFGMTLTPTLDVEPSDYSSEMIFTVIQN